MSERLRQALWERQDGELPADERRWLEDRLAADPRARREAERVSRLAARLEELPEMEPPPELRARIEAALDRAAVGSSASADTFSAGRGDGDEAAVHAGDRGDRVTPSRERSGSATSPGLLTSIFGGHWRPRLAWLAAGLVLGAVAYHAARSLREPWSPGELEEVYGAILPPVEGTEEVLDLPLSGDAGTLVVAGRKSLLRVELTLRGGEDDVEGTVEGVERSVGLVDLTLGGGDEVSLLALRHDATTSPDLQHREGTLRVVGLARGRLVLWARVADPAEPLEIEVSSHDETLARARFVLPEIEGSSSGRTNFSPR